MIEYIVGDMLECSANIRCHQVNCKGVMGSGLAKQVKSKYPETFNFYRNLCNKYSANKLLGSVQFTNCHDDTVLANMFGQDEYAYDGKQHTDYDALDSCISHVYDKAEKHDYSVAFPYKLGCERGGGDWHTVEGIIKKYFENSKILCKIVRLKND